MVRVYRCTVSQGEDVRLPDDLYRLPGWLSDRDVSRVRARERFRAEDPVEKYRPFVELRWVGEDLHVEAGYHTRLAASHWRQSRSLEQRQERARTLGEWRYERMPRFLNFIARALNDDILLPRSSVRAVSRCGDQTGFAMVPPHHEHDYDLRAVAELPREYLRKPIVRALEDVINHRHSKFAGVVDIRVEYRPPRKG